MAGAGLQTKLLNAVFERIMRGDLLKTFCHLQTKVPSWSHPQTSPSREKEFMLLFHMKSTGGQTKKEALFSLK